MDENSAILCDEEALFKIKELLSVGYDAEDIYIGATYLEFDQEHLGDDCLDEIDQADNDD